MDYIKCTVRLLSVVYLFENKLNTISTSLIINIVYIYFLCEDSSRKIEIEGRHDNLNKLTDFEE